MLREFNGGTKDLQYFAPTPDPAEVEALHVHALLNSKDLIYLDFSRAFLHSPETELVFTENPEGFGPPGTVSRLLRKINGRRDGTATFVEWLSVQLLQRGFRRSKLHPCTFLNDEMGVALACHVDDGVLACDPGLEQNLIEMLEELALVKVTGRLPANATERTEWTTFLARERCRRGDTIWKRPSTKFVSKACQLLGLEGCKPTAAPLTKELHDEIDGEPLDLEGNKLVQQVVGVLMYIASDCFSSQFAIRAISTDQVEPTTTTIKRLKHLVRFLKGRCDHVLEMSPNKQISRITMHVDSDWAGDKSTRKSVDCVVADLCGAVVYVSTKGQTFRALSSPEAELAAAHRGSLYGFFLQNMWKELFRETLPI